ncbi:hypothetical protein TNCV_2940801 [Trichonephila clavipes]|nr:hypothetical protein TNCV_2940801 [Trichonephila clavipes]
MGRFKYSSSRKSSRDVGGKGLESIVLHRNGTVVDLDRELRASVTEKELRVHKSLKTLCAEEGLMHVKSVEPQNPPVGFMGNLGSEMPNQLSSSSFECGSE